HSADSLPLLLRLPKPVSHRRGIPDFPCAAVPVIVIAGEDSMIDRLRLWPLGRNPAALTVMMGTSCVPGKQIVNWSEFGGSV
ncbi:MAG TPA: hypothetical protein VE621_17745, partial [Bryobacteraceae bacterium]|nr:hypothetical protein [Bryobacteraceae bacterium]